MNKVKFRADNDLDDETVLLLAAREGRILVSHDVSTLPPLFARFRREQHSPGVLLSPQLWPIGGTIDNLELIWELTEPEEWENAVARYNGDAAALEVDADHAVVVDFFTDIKRAVRAESEAVRIIQRRPDTLRAIFGRARAAGAGDGF